MKYFIQVLVIIVIAGIATGYYLKSQGNESGEVVIGVSVLLIAFVFMPLFIYYRYKDKDIKNFKITLFNDDDKEKK